LAAGLHLLFFLFPPEIWLPSFAVFLIFSFSNPEVCARRTFVLQAALGALLKWSLAAQIFLFFSAARRAPAVQLPALQ